MPSCIDGTKSEDTKILPPPPVFIEVFECQLNKSPG